MSLPVWIGVAALGAVGAVLRVLLTSAVAARARGALPIGTLAVNLVGALALGIVAGTEPTADVARLLGTGLLGAFTTFSTWVLEARRLAVSGRRGRAAALLVGSLVAGLAAFAAGRAMA